MKSQRGGFILGMIVGLLIGLALALAVALYVTKVPVPFINKVPQRTAEQDAAEAERNRNWDPNGPLSSPAAASSSFRARPGACDRHTGARSRAAGAGSRSPTRRGFGAAGARRRIGARRVGQGRRRSVYLFRASRSLRAR